MVKLVMNGDDQYIKHNFFLCISKLNEDKDIGNIESRRVSQIELK